MPTLVIYHKQRGLEASLPKDLKLLQNLCHRYLYVLDLNVSDIG